ncbi:MAG: 50S ribosomal protein L35 [Thermorudis peleae]|nr:50S ribosomal protein L35 [Thermorudis peleae]MBX6753920.1 50S ribosomal protein L35 [Thermorudis peleae]
MPKMKTKKAAAKRFKITAGGKVLRMRGWRGHNRLKKSDRVRRSYDRMLPVSPSDVHRVKRLLPYAF